MWGKNKCKKKCGAGVSALRFCGQSNSGPILDAEVSFGYGLSHAAANKKSRRVR
jgi:hypothetical protein